jgi:hypothetical protein
MHGMHYSAISWQGEKKKQTLNQHLYAYHSVFFVLFQGPIHGGLPKHGAQNADAREAPRIIRRH